MQSKAWIIITSSSSRSVADVARNRQVSRRIPVRLSRQEIAAVLRSIVQVSSQCPHSAYRSPQIYDTVAILSRKNKREGTFSENLCPSLHTDIYWWYCYQKILILWQSRAQSLTTWKKIKKVKFDFKFKIRLSSSGLVLHNV